MTLDSSTPFTRREWLRVASAASAAAIAGCARPGSSADTANLPSDAAVAPPVLAPGIQLYTVRRAMSRDVDGTLAALSAMGFREVELAGLHGRTPQSFRESLDRAGLRAPASHIDVTRFRQDRIAGTLEEARALGHAYLIVPWVDAKNFISAADWRRFGAELTEAGKKVRDAGFTFGYHNHDFELRPLPDGTRPYDVLLETDPALVRMEMDVFWLVHGGADPIAYFDRHPGRFDLIHVKDRTPAGGQTDLGKGTIDFARVYAHASKAGIRHAFAEQDEAPDEMSFARTAIAHLRTLKSA